MLIVPVQLADLVSPIVVTQIPYSGFNHASGTDASGVDFGVPFGTTVVAMAAGRVVSAFFGRSTGDASGSGYGNMITIEHSVLIDGLETRFLATYAHLTKASVKAFLSSEGLDVSTGRSWTAEDLGSDTTQIWIGAGEAIAETGDVGFLDGPNLHVHVSASLEMHVGKDGAYADGNDTTENQTLLSKLFFFPQQAVTIGPIGSGTPLIDLVEGQVFYGHLFGNDVFELGDSNDRVLSGDGNDSIATGRGADSANGGKGDDIIFSFAEGIDTLDGGGGNDGLWMDRSDLSVGQTLDLTSTTPIVLSDGTSLSNFEWFNLQMGLGADRITISGNANEQALAGNAGRDRAILDFSNETGTVTFRRVSDLPVSNTVISVGQSREHAIYMSGFEDYSVFAGSGNDTLDAQYMLTATLWGNEGNDRLFGTNGVDELYGGDGNDRIDGFNCFLGPDRLYGGKGDDTLIGTGDGTFLFGGQGNDVLTGGTSGTRFDRFVFRSFFGKDTITDFEAGPGAGDKIDLSALRLAPTDIQIEAAQNGFSSRLIVSKVGGTILLYGVTFDQVDFASDLIL